MTFHQTSNRIFASVLAISCWTLCAISFWQCLEAEDWRFAAGAALLASYLSYWVTLVAAGVFTAVALGVRGTAASLLVSQSLVATITMSAGYWSQTSWAEYLGKALPHQISHGPIPIAITLFWLLCLERGHLRWWHAILWPSVPFAYTVWMLSYGHFTGNYPYWQFQPSRVGYRVIAFEIAMFVAVTMVAGLLLILYDRLMMRSSTPQGGRNFVSRRARDSRRAVLEGFGAVANRAT